MHCKYQAKKAFDTPSVPLTLAQTPCVVWSAQVNYNYRYLEITFTENNINALIFMLTFVNLSCFDLRVSKLSITGGKQWSTL